MGDCFNNTYSHIYKYIKYSTTVASKYLSHFIIHVANIPFKIEILENVSNSCVPKMGICRCRITIASHQLPFNRSYHSDKSR
jgi:hypothetical protein